MTAPSLALHVVIATHGRATLLKRTLESLAQCDRPRELRTVWVVENGSDAGPRQLCERPDAYNGLPLRYVHLPEPGKAAALQHIINQIPGGLVIFTDDDVRVNQRFLTSYADAAHSFGEHAVFGGPLLVDLEASPEDWLRPYLPASVTGWTPDDPRDPCRKNAHFLGANYAAFVGRIQAVGGFRQELGTGAQGNPIGEEDDLQDRLARDGCRHAYVADATVWHYVPADRCSTQWVLDRVYRTWLTHGLRERKQHASPLLWGAPRWMWRRRFTLWLRAFLGSLFAEPKRQFKLQAAHRQWAGYMDGVRQRIATNATEQRTQ